ncbi:MAG: CdaR family protein [Thermoactinomyces sp.]
MDKWLEKDMVLRLISLLLAVLLWITVTEHSFSSFSTKGSTTIHDVSVQVKYDKEQFEMLSPSPKVELRLYGDKRVMDNVPGTYRVFVDAQNVGAGEHRLPVQVEGLPFGVNGEVEPKRVKVKLAQKVQKEMPVQVDIIGNIPEDLHIDKPIATPSKVLIRGTEAKLDQVKTVKAIVYLSDQTRSIETTARLQAYGEKGPVHQVEISPNVVSVKVPISIPYKKVPVSIEVKELPTGGYAVERIRARQDQVTVYGPKEYIENIQYYIGPQLDLKNARKDMTISVPLPLHDGALRVEPKEIEIYVKIVSAEQKSLENVPLTVTGQKEKQKIRILSPSGGNMNITLSGAPKNLAGINQSDIKALIDVSGLSEGIHEVPIRFILPNFIQVVGQTNPEARIEIR